MAALIAALAVVAMLAAATFGVMWCFGLYALQKYVALLVLSKLHTGLLNAAVALPRQQEGEWR